MIESFNKAGFDFAKYSTAVRNYGSQAGSGRTDLHIGAIDSNLSKRLGLL